MALIRSYWWAQFWDDWGLEPYKVKTYSKHDIPNELLPHAYALIPYQRVRAFIDGMDCWVMHIQKVDHDANGPE